MEEVKVVGVEEERGKAAIIFGAPKSAFGGFLDFVRERGVMGLAIGFVLGTAVQKVVTAFVVDIVNPTIGVFMGRAEGLRTFTVGPFLIGDFLSVTLDFLLLILIIYLVFKVLGLDRLDKAKE
jgi:large conductance mechanosensitive channel